MQCNPKLYKSFCNEKSETIVRKNSDNKIGKLHINNKTRDVKMQDVDDAIIRFIIQDMQPFIRVESEAFQNLLSSKKFDILH